MSTQRHLLYQNPMRHHCESARSEPITKETNRDWGFKQGKTTNGQ